MKSSSGSDNSDEEKIPSVASAESWVKIQHSTFINWINDKLKTTSIKDLSKDMRSGENLCKLMNVLKGHSIGKIIANPVNHYAASGNIALAFQAMTKDGVKLINIGAEDISKGNLKLILGLMWTLIRTYQIKSTGKLPPKKMMLEWINAVLHPYRSINNFTMDWNDGIALHGIIEYCQPGTFPDWMHLKASNYEQNCRSAMNMASNLFGIPIVVKPEYMSNKNLDELSMMTQLSYFMSDDSPGFDTTLDWVNSKLTSREISNFTTDWNDGKVACELAVELGAKIPNYPNISGTNEEVCRIGMTASEKQLNVKHIISSTDMTIPTIDHLGLMAYAAWHRLVPDKKPKRVVEKKVINNLPKKIEREEYFQEDKNFNSLDKDENILEVDPDYIEQEEREEEEEEEKEEKKEVQSEDVKVIETIEKKKKVEFIETPRLILNHSPTPPPVFTEPPKPLVQNPSMLVSIIDTWRVFLTQTIKVDSSSFGTGSIRAEAHSPSNDIEDLLVTRIDDCENCIDFKPNEKGNWKIQIFYENMEITQSPFYVNVYDASLTNIIKTQFGKTEIHGLYSFEVDCLQVGCKELDVFVTNANNTIVPCQCTPCGLDRYKLSFQPNINGIFDVNVFVGGVEVPGSPFQVDASDVRKVYVDGLGLSECICGKESMFKLHASTAPNKHVEVIIMSPSGHNIKASVVKINGDTYSIAYKAIEEGNHIVEIFYDGMVITGSPFKIRARRPNIVVKNLNRVVAKETKNTFEIDASEVEDKGLLEIDSSCPVEGYQLIGKHTFVVTYRPEISGSVDFIIKYDGHDINGSPYEVYVE